MQLNHEFNEFLKKHSKSDDSHTIYSGFSQYKLNLPFTTSNSLFTQNQSPLYKQFFDFLKTEYLAGNRYWFNERQFTSEIKHSGIVIDIDAFQTSAQRTITEHTCTELVVKLAKIIYKYVEIPAEYESRAFVLMNPTPAQCENNPSNYKEGMHILFPGIKVDKMLKVMIIKEFATKAQSILESVGLFSLNAPTKGIEGYMVDFNSWDVPMQLYGTIRQDKKYSHELKFAYKITFGTTFRWFRINDYEYKRKVGVQPGFMPINLILELSVHYEGNMRKTIFTAREQFNTVIETGYNSLLLQSDNDIEQIKKSVDIIRTSSYIAEEVYNYVRCLSKERGLAGKYKEWSYVVKLIVSIDIRFAAYAKLYSIDCDATCWFEKDGITELNKIVDRVSNDYAKCSSPTEFIKHALNALKKLAKIDNPEEFSNVIKNTLSGKISMLFNNREVISQMTIANLTCELIRDRFYCVPIRKVGFSNQTSCYWLEYITDDRNDLNSCKKPFIYKWCRDDAFPKELFFIISIEIPKIFNNTRHFYQSLLDKETDTIKKKSLTKIVCDIEKKILLCQTDGTINGIENLCKKQLVDTTILSRLDKDNNLFGVSNGILVFEGGKNANIKLIQSHGQYYISQTTDIPYIPYNPQDKTVIKVEKMISEIFPDEKIRDGFFMHMSQLFVRFSCPRYLTILYSLGSSGKSLLMDFFKKILGFRGSAEYSENFGYYNTSVPEVITVEKRDTNGVDHHLIKFNGARLVHLPEGKKIGGTILMHVVKRLNDDPGTRGMYGDVKNTSYGGIITYLSNNETRFSDYNYATERRTVYLRMPVTFKPDLPDKDVTKYLRCTDKKYEDRVKKHNWAVAGLSIMTHYWLRFQIEYEGKAQKMYEATGLYSSTINYMKQFNILLKFTTHAVEPEEESEIPFLDLCESYAEWSRRELGLIRAPPIKDVMNEIREHYIYNIRTEPNTGREIIFGIKFRN